MGKEKAVRIVRKDGVAVIEGANTKVVELVSHVRAHGGSPEEIHRQLPHLSVEQVRVALAYYEENRSEVDAEIERRRAWVERMRREFPVSPVVEEIRRRRGGRGG